jgi:hypothetical protein
MHSGIQKTLYKCEKRIHTPYTSTLQAMDTLHVAVEGITPCTSILLVVEISTLCTFILLVAERGKQGGRAQHDFSLAWLEAA